MVATQTPLPVSLRSSLREAFVQRAERPTYEELSAEFHVNRNTIAAWSSDESWVALRVAHQEKLMEKSDAMGVMLRAAAIDKRVIELCADAVMRGFQTISRIYDDFDHAKAMSTRASIANTLTFATKNLTESCKLAGIIGLPKALADEGKEGNGRWNPDFVKSLSQLNVTVNNITSQPVPTPAAPVPVAPDAVPEPTKPNTAAPADQAGED